MRPLHELLHRIKWDAEFGKGEFALGYYDRVLNEELLVPVSSIVLDTTTDRPALTCAAADGVAHRLPLHRVHTVYKDGEAIWARSRR